MRFFVAFLQGSDRSVGLTQVGWIIPQPCDSLLPVQALVWPACLASDFPLSAVPQTTMIPVIQNIRINGPEAHREERS